MPAFPADAAVYFVLTHFDRSISPPCFIPKWTARPCLFRFPLPQLGQSYLNSALSSELDAAGFDCFRSFLAPALSFFEPPLLPLFEPPLALDGRAATGYPATPPQSTLPPCFLP